MRLVTGALNADVLEANELFDRVLAIGGCSWNGPLSSLVLVLLIGGGEDGGEV